MISRILCFFGLHMWATPTYSERVLDRKGRTYWATRYDHARCRNCGQHK